MANRYLRLYRMELNCRNCQTRRVADIPTCRQASWIFMAPAQRWELAIDVICLALEVARRCAGRMGRNVRVERELQVRDAGFKQSNQHELRH